MNIETTPLENHRVKLSVDVEPEQMQSAMRRAARQLANRTKIPGFRPGKAPYNIIERFVGKEMILDAAIDLLVKELYPKVLDEAKIKPYGPGDLENMPSLESPKFEFVVPLQPEVILGEYKSIRAPYELPVTTDADVENVLNDLRERRAVTEPVERPVQEGDRVYVYLSGTRKNPAEGEVPTLIEERRNLITVESETADTKDEWPFPGFSRNLISLSAGDERAINYTFPEDAELENLRGKEIEYKFKVDQVRSRSVPALDDEFAKSVGEYENLEALRTDIRANLEEQKLSEYNRDYNEKTVGEIVEKSTIKFPPQMLDDETDEFVHQLENRLTQQRMDMDTYLKMRQMDIDALKVEVRPLAENRLKRTLVLVEVAKAENIQVEDADVQAETMRTLDQFSHSLPAKEVKKLGSPEFIRYLVNDITADMLTHRTLDRLQVIAKGEYPAAVETGVSPVATEAEPVVMSGETEAQPVETVSDSEIPEENVKE